MKSDERRELQMLEAVAQEQGHVTQRSLSTQLGIALGLTDIYLRRLTRKGYIKCVSIQPKPPALPDHAQGDRREGAADV